MKLVLIADTHGRHEELNLPKGDILIHAGDLSMVGKTSEYESVAKWLNNADFKHVIVIAGNHDFSIQKFIPMLAPNVHYLENSGIEIDGIKFWGSPITPRFGPWAHMANRGEDIRKYWDMIPYHTDVLITHGPPLEILDETIGGDNVGCEELLRNIQQFSHPLVHVFGHIHEAYGFMKKGYTDYYNASVVNEYYKAVNAPWVIEKI